VLVPELLRAERRSTLENYVAGTDLVVEEYPIDDGNVDFAGLEATVDEEVVMIYVENPTVRGTIEEHLAAVGNLADDNDALYTLGSDPIALSLLEQPVDVGADVVVGDASVLGLPTSYGMGLGLFATREDYLRQVPGRLVGVSEDATDRRAFTLTLQTREQHIRRERATSNICTNQAWVALRTAMHAAVLGSTGMVDLAKRDVIRAGTSRSASTTSSASKRRSTTATTSGSSSPASTSPHGPSPRTSSDSALRFTSSVTTRFSSVSPAFPTTGSIDSSRPSRR